MTPNQIDTLMDSAMLNLVNVEDAVEKLVMHYDQVLGDTFLEDIHKQKHEDNLRKIEDMNALLSIICAAKILVGRLEP